MYLACHLDQEICVSCLRLYLPFSKTWRSWHFHPQFQTLKRAMGPSGWHQCRRLGRVPHRPRTYDHFSSPGWPWGIRLKAQMAIDVECLDRPCTHGASLGLPPVLWEGKGLTSPQFHGCLCNSKQLEALWLPGSRDPFFFFAWLMQPTMRLLTMLYELWQYAMTLNKTYCRK